MDHVVKLTNATIRRFVNYRHRPKVFASPVTFAIARGERWAVIGTSKQQFMQLLAGDFATEPAHSREYPALASGAWPSSLVEFLQFTNNNYGKAADGAGNGGFTHLGARYEFFKDLEIDIRTTDFVCDRSYNSSHAVDTARYSELIGRLALAGLEHKFINGLSNGQFRRARIAKALYRDTALLLLDDPFLGLDPTAAATVSQALHHYSAHRSIVLGLRVQDAVPDWITHVAIVDDTGVVAQGSKAQVAPVLEGLVADHHAEQAAKRAAAQQAQAANSRRFDARQRLNQHRDTVIIEFDGVSVVHDKPIIQNLQWKVHHGEKWHIRGNNGTGKTTILALVTLDHPQSWNSKIAIAGVKRKTGRTNYFDNNGLIGFTSPELHALFPKHRTVFQTIGNGFDVGNYLPPTQLTDAQTAKIDALISEFGFHRDTQLKDLSVSDQKVVLFLRAIVKEPPILILDEALSAMAEDSIDKCKAKIDLWTHGCVLVVGHVAAEIPQCDKFIRLVDPPDAQYEFGICE